MANILMIPMSGAIIFDSQAAQSNIISPTSAAPRLEYDNIGGLKITSLTTGSSAINRFAVDGFSGRLFSVTDAVTGTIFSVNDSGGLPVIQVDSNLTDVITLGTYGFNTLVVNDTKVGIGNATPNEKLTVSGNISSTNIVYASGGNSNLWNSVYTSVSANSANWSGGSGATTYTTVNANSANWSSVYSTVSSASANYILADGNSKGANIIIGTNDAYALSLETNGTTRMSISADGLVSIDSIPVSRGIGTNTTNIAIGRGLTYNTTGIDNTSVGKDALSANLGGGSNTAIGYNSLKSNRTGGENIAIGASALTNNTTASFNTAVGMGALNGITADGSNTAIGSVALSLLTSGASNVAIGRAAGYSTVDTDDVTQCNSSIFIGANSGPSYVAASNEIVIGTSTYGAGDNTTSLNNTSTTLTRIRGTNAHVLDVTGQVTVGSTITAGSSISANGNISVATSAQGIILVAPNLTKWKITVTNSGTLSTTAI